MTNRQKLWKAWSVKNGAMRNKKRRELNRKARLHRNRLARLWREAHPEQSKIAAQKYREKHIYESRLRGLKNAVILRREVVLKYGRVCRCCGEARREFLALDHIGGVKPKNLPRSGQSLYRALHKKNWPLGFRILCHNCNVSHGLYGYCPHKSWSLISNQGT